MAAIVTQPPAKRDRGKKLMPSPVAQFALDTGFPSDLIFTPERAGEVIVMVSVCEFEFFSLGMVVELICNLHNQR